MSPDISAEPGCSRLRALAAAPGLRDVRPWRPGGALSQLFLGRDHRTEATVVVKFPRGDLAGPYWAPAFARERELHESLDALGAVAPTARCHTEVGQWWTEVTGEQPPLVTAWSGTDLSRWSVGHQGARAIELVWARLAAALGALHLAGVVHRDIRPENAVIRQGAVRLIDLTFARSVDQPGIAAGEVARLRYARPLTNARYAAPETWLGPPSSASDWRGCDVYALGATLYRLWGADTPAESVHDQSLLDRLADLVARCADPIARGDYQRQITAVLARRWPVPALPGPAPALAQLAERMCSVDPRRRPTMTEVSATVADWMRESS